MPFEATIMYGRGESLIARDCATSFVTVAPG